MRAFLGIDFDDTTKASIVELQNQLRMKAKKGRWKHKDNFHLTLKFFADIDDEQVSEIETTINLICQNAEPFDLSIGELGIFERKGTISVLWTSLMGEIKKLNELHQHIEDALSTNGFEQEKRKFIPHVTIAQDLVLTCPVLELKQIRSNISFPEIKVDKIYLFKSEQLGAKRVYTKIAEFVLQKIL